MRILVILLKSFNVLCILYREESLICQIGLDVIDVTW